MTFTAVNARLLAKYGGDVVLSRFMPGAPPVNEWDPPNPPVEISETLRFIATAAETELVAASMVQVDDLLGVLAAPVTEELNPPLPADTISVGSESYTILSASAVHSRPGGALHFAVQARA
ncbi:hypothetical protein M3P36_08685 [Altererythrobacter sp. KTW20L]|uniref:hypothetical protein n=1 Tax=Altererythrobacter sp. KTW20L TaxID=2942210 RepID=UPI0020BED41F|nr:hypothetical protein [Altererythrobacter sp. KTW20L]MCL6251116.1 hypothetical protein [Altererythrobacter sp. KTW20L]